MSEYRSKLGKVIDLTIRNPDGSYMDEDQIVDHIVRVSGTPEIKKQLCSFSKKEDLIRLHNGLGRYIRNSYGLWMEDNPLTRAGNMYVNPETGIADHPFHADQCSMRIIERIWEVARKMVNDDVGVYYCPYIPLQFRKKNDIDSIWDAVESVAKGT